MDIFPSIYGMSMYWKTRIISCFFFDSPYLPWGLASFLSWKKKKRTLRGGKSFVLLILKGKRSLNCICRVRCWADMQVYLLHHRTADTLSKDFEKTKKKSIYLFVILVKMRKFWGKAFGKKQCIYLRSYALSDSYALEGPKHNIQNRHLS